MQGSLGSRWGHTGVNTGQPKLVRHLAALAHTAGQSCVLKGYRAELIKRTRLDYESGPLNRLYRPSSGPAYRF